MIILRALAPVSEGLLPEDSRHSSKWGALAYPKASELLFTVGELFENFCSSMSKSSLVGLRKYNLNTVVIMCHNDC